MKTTRHTYVKPVLERKKNLPPMSAMNGLQLAETDEMIKEEGLNKR